MSVERRDGWIRKNSDGELCQRDMGLFSLLLPFLIHEGA